MKVIKNLVQRVVRSLGYEIRQLPDRLPPASRPVGDMECFLGDLAARGFRPRSILDVGANRGEWSRIAAEVFPDAFLTLIEPQTEMRVDLETFRKDHPNSRWVEAGAGSQQGELELTVWGDLQGSSFLPEIGSAVASDKIRRRVPVVTVDTLFQDGVPLPEMVKIDVQGFEMEVLRGARSLMGATELFVLEVSLFEFLPGNPLLHEIIQFMADSGYLVYDVPGWARRPFDGALGQVDLAFARRSGALRQSCAW